MFLIRYPTLLYVENMFKLLLLLMMMVLNFYMPGRILHIAWHCSGDYIVTGSVNCVRLWSLKEGRVSASSETVVTSIPFLRLFVSYPTACIKNR